jgi:hypothetical protein
MKIEKLDALLNKVVEYNQPGKCRFKGFLYHSYSGYYIKVVETVDGTDIAVDDLLYLKKGEEEYVTHAEKPKLMRVSMKSWHYRLIKFVLRDNAPTPKTMQNGCPYFWLLVFSLFAFPFLMLWKGFVFLLLLLPKVFVWLLEKAVNAYMYNLEDATAYEYYANGRYGRDKLPLTVKTFFKMKEDFTGYCNDEFMDYFLLEKYNLSPEANPDEYKRKKIELSDKWMAWREEIKRRDEEQRKRDVAERERRRVEMIEWERRQEIRKAKWDALIKPYKDGMNGIFNSIRKTFAFKVKKVKKVKIKKISPNLDWKNIIKRTKQVVGAVITLILLTATYFVVNGLVYVIMVVASWCGHNWEIFAVLGCVAVACGIIYVLYVFITGWVQTVVNRYNAGKKVWYVEPLIYAVYYPLKYAVIVIAYGLLYILWIPVKFICYTFLWKLVLVPSCVFLGTNIWKLICAFGRGLANSTGVFGEYFSASYTDYCPGLEWVDTEEEDK